MQKVLARDETGKAHRAGLNDRHAADLFGGHAVGKTGNRLVGISNHRQRFIRQPITKGFITCRRFPPPSQNIGAMRQSSSNCSSK
jgi:hypothetical protein